MGERFHIFASAIILGLFFFQMTYACRFNVRETGFVDLEIQRYIMAGYIDNYTPEHIITEMKSIAGDLLVDSNIAFELINIDKQKDHPAMGYVKTLQIKSYPAVALISPDGQSLPIPFATREQGFQQSLRKAINNTLLSSIRSELQKKVSLYYGVVLLIEGRQNAENQAARKAIEEAIVKVKTNMDLMPKPIKNPPVMLILKNDRLTSDPVLLWTLGLEADKVDKPYAAVYYGRARWIGPLFKDKEITRNNLSEILLVIGADCECGLDKNWLQGTMLPLRWDKHIQAEISDNLGFDPENPMIKMEINHIMRTGYLNSDGLDRSVGLDSVSGNRKGIAYANEAGKIAEVSPVVTDSIAEEPALGNSLYISAAILGFLLVLGLIIILRRTILNRKSH